MEWIGSTPMRLRLLQSWLAEKGVRTQPTNSGVEVPTMGEAERTDRGWLHPVSPGPVATIFPGWVRPPLLLKSQHSPIRQLWESPPHPPFVIPRPAQALLLLAPPLLLSFIGRLFFFFQSLLHLVDPTPAEPRLPRSIPTEFNPERQDRISYL